MRGHTANDSGTAFSCLVAWVLAPLGPASVWPKSGDGRGGAGDKIASLGSRESTLANFVRKFGDMDHFRPTTAGYGLKLNW